ncbi:GNAT family N-acetyltransferase [Mycoplasmatota bacterium WC44]
MERKGSSIQVDEIINKINNMEIRESKYTDLDQIIMLQKEWAKEEITIGYVPDKKSDLEIKLGKYFFVCELNKKIIGYVYGTVHQAKNMAVMDDEELYIEIDDLYTSLGNRGTGTGSLLLERILRVAKDNGIERSKIYSSTKDMESIIKFYKKHNYKTWYVQMFK